MRASATALFMWLLCGGIVHGQTAPSQEWEYNGFSWQLFSGPKTWQQAESWCTEIGQGWHLASLTTPQEFDYTKTQLVAASANRTIYKNGGVFLTGCGEPRDIHNMVWMGLHDPADTSATGATWQDVAATFTWSDGRKSPFLTQDANDYFTMNATEQESCIGFMFCSADIGTNPGASLTKHPCDWKMSFLCKGPASGTTGTRTAPNSVSAPGAASPASPAFSAPTPSGCQPGTTCAVVVGPVVAAVGAVIVGLLAYLAARSSHRKAPTSTEKNMPAPAAGSHIINVNPSIHVTGVGAVAVTGPK